MNQSGPSSSKHQSTRKESLMGKKNRLPKGLSQSKTQKNMMSKKTLPVPKRQIYSEHLLQGENHSTDFDTERPSVFTEIWPSSEPSSPSDSPTFDNNVQNMSRIKSSELDMSHSSVLSRYVDRFRHGRPQSREERQQKAYKDEELQLPFWWASSSSMPPSLTPEKSSKEYRLACHNQAHDPSRESMNMPDTSQGEIVESEILQFQKKASRLLQNGDFCLEEDSLPASSDGVGCSDFSSPVSADEPVRRPISSLYQCNIAKNSPLVIPPRVAPTRPEEDILFQWRLRGKMEKAREWSQAQEHFNQRDLHFAHPVMTSQTFHPPDLPQGTKHQPTREPHLSTSDRQTPATTAETPRTPSVQGIGSSVAPSQALAHVPSHMHLLCNILPCPTQQTHPGEERVLQRLDSHITVLPQTTLNSVTKCMSPLQTPVTVAAKKDLHLCQTKSTDAPKKQPEKNENPLNRKKLPGVPKQQKNSQQQKQKYTEVKKKCRSDGASPPSPIHSTLGQVVSEVLFRSKDSTRVQEFSPTTPSSSIFATQQNNSHKSGEAISQLLKEAEDSDETEFEDDPLLQVLRKQRKWFKEQINEVDTFLKEFPEQHNIE